MQIPAATPEIEHALQTPCDPQNGVLMSDPVSDSVTDAEHIDVLIIGAGISGINAAYHLSTQLPDRSFVASMPSRASAGPG